MKTLTALISLAALVAFIVTSFSFVASVSTFFAAGFLALMAADYRRAFRPLAAYATAGTSALPRRERLGLAA
jgi:hypothetical protein